MMLAALIFAGLPLVTLRNEHVTVDLLDPVVPDWLLRIQHVVACLIGFGRDRPISPGGSGSAQSRMDGGRRDHGAAQVQARLPHLCDERPDGADRAGAAGAGRAGVRRATSRAQV